MIILVEMEKIVLPKSYDYTSVFLSMRCNLDCSYCVNNAPDANLQRNVFREPSGEEWVKALNRIISPEGVPISFVGGEPSLHKDFIYILNNLNPKLGIDVVTNLWWGKNKLENFIKQVHSKRIQNNSPFPSIRASYHPEQMGEGEKLIENAKRLKGAGFEIGVESIMYPSPEQLEAIEKMALKCKQAELSFRPKSFIGVYEGVDDKGQPFSIVHGDYSKYSGAVFGEKTLDCKCRTSNLLINPEGNVYRCQRDLILAENPVGNIFDENFYVRDEFISCKKYGECHPCDVKVKTNSREEMGTTLVEIKDVKYN